MAHPSQPEWQMTDEEVAELDAVALYGLRKISQRIWQHG